MTNKPKPVEVVNSSPNLDDDTLNKENLELDEPVTETSLGKVTLRVKDPKYSGFFYKVSPVLDRSGRLKKDQPDIPPSEASKHVYIVTENTRATLYDGITFDLSDEKDRITWGWVKYCKHMIAGTKEEAIASPTAIFYIEDTVKEARKKLNVEKEKTKYKLRVFETDLEEKRSLLTAVHEYVEGKSEEELEERIIELIESDFKNGKQNTYGTITYFMSNPKVLRMRLFAMRLIAEGKVKEERGLYFYNGEIIASSFEEFIRFLTDAKNKTLVQVWEREMYR